MFDEKYFRRRGALFPSMKAFLYSFFIKLFLRPRTLLDVGCARGELIRAVKRLGIEGWGLDISPDAVNGVPDWVKKRIQLGTILNLPYADKQFELVCALAVLEHIPANDAERAVRELLRAADKRVLVQICVKDTPGELTRHYRRDPTHVNIQTTKWWKEKFAAWNIKYRQLCPFSGVFLLSA